jgi:capsular exopolysaccharide synthesis family protein
LLEKSGIQTSRLSRVARILFEDPQLKDAFSALHAGVRVNANDAASRCILVTSTHPQEGKTTIASCLALTAALAGQKTLLVDGDLRKPELGSAAGIADKVGLAEILQGEMEHSQAVHMLDLEAMPEGGRLSVMSAGQKSASILPAIDWAAARMKFQQFSQQFGIVIVDSPPILAANDSLLLAELADAILLVIAAGHVDREDVLRAVDQLKAATIPVIGAVLNAFDPELHSRSNRPYRPIQPTI